MSEGILIYVAILVILIAVGIPSRIVKNLDRDYMITHGKVIFLNEVDS